MRHVHPADAVQHRGAHHAGGVARGAGQLTRARLRQGQEFRHAVRRHLIIHREDEDVGAQPAERREIRDRVVARAPHQRRRRAMRAVGGDHHGMAVGRRACRRHRGDRAIGAGAVVHHHLRAPVALQQGREGARHGVGARPGGEGDDHGDGPAGLPAALPARQARCQEGRRENSPPRNGEGQGTSPVCRVVGRNVATGGSLVHPGMAGFRRRPHGACSRCGLDPARPGSP